MGNHGYLGGKFHGSTQMLGINQVLCPRPGLSTMRASGKAARVVHGELCSRMVKLTGLRRGRVDWAFLGSGGRFWA
jgi:hypothetical protein